MKYVYNEEAPVKTLLKHGLCVIPILAKYTAYSNLSKEVKPPDKMVDDLFDSISTVLRNIKDPEGKPLQGDSQYCEDSSKEAVYKDVCPVLKKIDQAKTRFDKVEAIEAAIGAQHDTGNILEYGCGLGAPEYFDYLEYERILVKEILDFLRNKP
jgi:hypothetical protein